MTKLINISLIVLFQYSISLAQNSKAQEYYNKSMKFMADKKPDEATVSLLKSIEIDPTYADSYFKLGQIAEANRNTEKATSFYEKAISLKPNNTAFIQGYTYLGSRLLKTGNFEKAKDFLTFSLQNSKPNSFIIKQLTKQIASCNFGIDALKKALTINYSEVKGGISNQKGQCFPVLTADKETLIFTALTEAGNENLYISKLQNGQWTTAENLSTTINTPNNNVGTCSISADGRTLVFTSCNNANGLGSCDLYISKKEGNDWTTPKNLGTSINSRYWEAQPSLSNDGRVLYFSSDRPTGLGRKDLYMSELDEKENWTPAVNLGKVVNTENDEISPFIHANNKTLFFASDGHIGMGGLDLFMTENKFNTFTKPENLGSPINTPNDQVSLFITADGKKAYYSLDDKKNTKLYEFDIPKVFSDKFKQANFVKGTVQDAQTKQKISAEIELFDVKTNQVISKVRADSLTGEYTAVLPNGSNYALYINKNGYFFKSLSFDFSEKLDADGKKINISLEPIRKDAKEVLNNIFFDTNKWELKPTSLLELEKLVTLLKQNPNLVVEISGHTDDVGKDSDNLILSQKRAQAVVDYLTKNNIITSKIKALGYGKTKPLFPNTSEENRKKNRRIEVRIL